MSFIRIESAVMQDIGSIKSDCESFTGKEYVVQVPFVGEA